MKIKDLKDRPEIELKKLLSEKQALLREMNFKVSQRQLKKVREIRETKQIIARILTLLNNKKSDEK